MSYDLHSAIADGNADAIIETASDLGNRLATQDLSRTQIRTIFGMVKQMQSTGFDRNRFRLIIPKLVYAQAREPKLKPLVEVLTDAINRVDDDTTRFDHFVQLFEAIVAYHYAEQQGGSS